MRAGAVALGAELSDRLPRYEGHLSRELDKSLARYARLRDARPPAEGTLEGEVLATTALIDGRRSA